MRDFRQWTWNWRSTSGIYVRIRAIAPALAASTDNKGEASMQHQTRSSLLWISTLVVGIATQLGCEHPNQIKITAGGGNKPMLDAQDGDEITWVNIAPHFLAASPCKSGDIKPCKVELKGKY